MNIEDARKTPYGRTSANPLNVFVETRGVASVANCLRLL